MRRAAFSLIELLIVVAVITILAIMALFTVRQQLAKARDARRKADMHKIQAAVEEYEKDHDCYPPADLVVCRPTDTGLVPYLARIPCDPVTDDSYAYEPSGPVCASWYRLFGVLENLGDPDLKPNIGPGGLYNFYRASPNAPAPTGSVVPTGTPGATSGPTPPPSLAPDNFYGCKNGVCVPILWDYSRPGPECDPNYQNPNCYSFCGPPANECQPWR